MTTFKRPMLAASLLSPHEPHTDENILAAMSKLRYPVLATVKKDGVRALRMNGTLLSRTLHVIPNKSIVERSLVLPGGFDMELYNPELSYNEIQSIVMCREHEKSDMIQFHILDWFGKKESMFLDTYQGRVNNIHWWYEKERCCFGVGWSLPRYCKTTERLFEFFIEIEETGEEGICFRTPNSPYKQGRSTLKEQYLVKLSRFIRTELTIIGFEEQMENTNPEKYSPVGLMNRRSCNEYMLGKNTLGALVCLDPKTKETISVGTGVGLTDRLRKEIWDNRDKYLGREITVKHKLIGQKDKLRHPIFVGFREKGQ